MGLLVIGKGVLIFESEVIDLMELGCFFMRMSLLVNEVKVFEFRGLNYWFLGMRLLFYRNDVIVWWK